MTSINSRQVFAFNADPDQDVDEETLSDDDDYNPGSIEAVYCYEDELDILAILGTFVFLNRCLSNLDWFTLLFRLEIHHT